MAVLGPVQTTTALALPAVTTVPCHNIKPHARLGSLGCESLIVFGHVIFSLCTSKLRVA